MSFHTLRILQYVYFYGPINGLAIRRRMKTSESVVYNNVQLLESLKLIESSHKNRERQWVMTSDGTKLLESKFAQAISYLWSENNGRPKT